jgi:hypothetical protein
VLPEGELIKDSHYPCLICLVVLFDSGKDSVFDLPVIKVELFVPTYLHGDLLPLLLDVKCPHDLSESALVNDFSNQVPVPDLLAHPSLIVTIRIGTLAEALSAIATHSIDGIIEGELCLLEWGELV